MMGYLQTSTNNPYGHRPWATKLYQGFEDYGFLKQPQNTIIRGDQTMRPDIYKPPELKPAGMSGITRRRRGGLGIIMAPVSYGVPASMLRMATPTNGSGPARYPVQAIGPAPAIFPIYPPSIVPPVATVVGSSPQGVVYALPGQTAVPGSPYMPPAPGELTLPAPAPAATTPAADAWTSFTNWLTAQTYVSGLPNGAILAVGAVLLFSMSQKKGGRF
jgi:hypothetical protein